MNRKINTLTTVKGIGLAFSWTSTLAFILAIYQSAMSGIAIIFWVIGLVMTLISSLKINKLVSGNRNKHKVAGILLIIVPAIIFFLSFLIYLVASVTQATENTYNDIGSNNYTINASSGIQAGIDAATNYEDDDHISTLKFISVAVGIISMLAGFLAGPLIYAGSRLLTTDKYSRNRRTSSKRTTARKSVKRPYTRSVEEEDDLL